MWEGIVGMGGSNFVWCTDKKIAFKSHAVWHEGKRRAYCEDDCEEKLAREAAIYDQLGEHPQVLRYYGLKEIHPGHPCYLHRICSVWGIANIPSGRQGQRSTIIRAYSTTNGS